MRVKGHQAALHQDIYLVFHETSAVVEMRTTTATVDSGHGRIEKRRRLSARR